MIISDLLAMLLDREFAVFGCDFCWQHIERLELRYNRIARSIIDNVEYICSCHLFYIIQKGTCYRINGIHVDTLALYCT